MAKLKSIPSVLLREREASVLFQVHGLTTESCASRLKAFGIDVLPAIGKSVAGDDLLFMSNGPGMWLVQAQQRDSESTLQQLRDTLADTDATLTDLSSARLIVEVSGSSSRQFLKKGCPVDIDSLTTDDVVATAIGHLGVTIHCLGEDFVVYALQSFGTDFWEWCRLNVMEFNI